MCLDDARVVEMEVVDLRLRIALDRFRGLNVPSGDADWDINVGDLHRLAFSFSVFWLHLGTSPGGQYPGLSLSTSEILLQGRLSSRQGR